MPGLCLELRKTPVMLWSKEERQHNELNNTTALLLSPQHTLKKKQEKGIFCVRMAEIDIQYLYSDNENCPNIFKETLSHFFTVSI